jgi:hypothetical protein
MLPDDVLLEIFNFYVDEDWDEAVYYKKEIEKWQKLVHVCHRWRSVVFGSPRRLNLRLVCAPKTPARDTLDVWPSLPLLIKDDGPLTEDVDGIIAVLERSDCVVQINLYSVNGPNLENILAAMQVPFPELTRLGLWLREGMVSVFPDSFLGGSAPRLQHLDLDRIPFPGLPKLLLSAPHLVNLRLRNIPHSGHISPEAIVAVLSTLTTLKYLVLEFESPQSRPDWANRRLPPPTRSVLPVLTSFSFKGACEYLEDVVTCINAPRLGYLSITLFNQIVFETPQFIQFISRSPISETFEKAVVVFGEYTARVKLSSPSGHKMLNTNISCRELDWQVSSMEQVCTSCLPPLSMLEDLYIYESPYLQPVWKDNIENTLWLELLQPFTGVKNLYLSEKFASLITPALQELTGGSTTEVLPSVQNIFLEEIQPSGTVQPSIQQFAATRQVSHPIAVSRWDNSKEDMENNYYLY